MSFNRKSSGNTARRVLADSANAKHRFGFAGEFGSPITLAPKLSDLWYVEFNTVTNNGLTVTEDISALAKSVSPISIQMSNMPVDQYGKRIYVPTRVDFPEVNITMHDTIDGKMFGVAESIYNKFFKNQDANVSGANAEEVLTSAHEHGRRLPEDKHEYYHQHFEKITIYHFFGNLDGPGLGAPPSSLPRNAGAGTLQKIELINPLVTTITFSSSDYSVTELRTIDLSFQPENIIIGQVSEDVSFPKWMTEGMEYMQHKLSPQLKRKEGNLYPDHFGDTGYGPRTEDGRFKENIQSEEDLLRQDQQEYEDTNRKLSELMTLYNAQIQNPNETGNEELERALKKRIGVISAARAKRFSKYADHPKNKFDTPYEATYTNPDIPTFGGIGNSNPPKDMFPQYSTDIGDSLVQELIGSFFGKRKFNASNIKKAFTNKMIEATGFPMNTAIDGRRIIDGAKGSAQGAYQTTEKALKPVKAENIPVFKTNSTDFPPGVSKVIKDKFK